MVHTISGTTTTKDYCNNVVYENGVQKMLLTEEGYVDLSNSTYYYYLKDHQGNNRVVLSSGGTAVEVSHYYPFGGVFASTGNVQPYKYNGKEFDTKKGLNWYDYGARHYDAALGRWFMMDPLAEKYYAWSPYNYCVNNPVIFVDPNGEFPCIYVETKGLGHTFVTTGSGENTIVYTYGRYGALDGNKSSMQGLSRYGEGVLVVLKGDEAVNYIKKEVLNKSARVYEFTKGSDEIVNAYFNELFESSVKTPSIGNYEKTGNAKVIDTYDLWNNNCTTKSAESIKVGTEGKIDLKSVSPTNIDTQLHYKSKIDNSEIKKIDINKIIEEYELYKR